MGREGSGGTGALSSWGSVSIEMRCFCLTSRQIGGRSLTFLMLGITSCVGEFLFPVPSFFWLIVVMKLLKVEN